MSKITKFEMVWCFSPLRGKRVSFYRPAEIPDGFHCLGYYCQANSRPLRGYVLVAREAITAADDGSESSLPPLSKPLSYTLLWGEEDQDEDVSGFVWMPKAPAGYRATGIVVTDKPEQPELDAIRCVREDLTEPCEAFDLICSIESKNSKAPFRVWNTRPLIRGMWESGVSVGSFFSSSEEGTEDIGIACLRNSHESLHSSMPNLDQVHAIIKHYGPRVFFHRDEAYFPSSIQWFFKNGAVLHRDGDSKGQKIDQEGSNLPSGGVNDGQFWLDLPDTDDEDREFLKRGNLESTELYVHIKPALGGTFTDLSMWVFCPFNGPATLKVGPVSVTMTRIGEHVGDWEHFTLRVSNFNGELWAAYFSQHNCGRWVDASDLEFVDGNRPAIYSAKGGHASFPHPGSYLLGSTKLGVGVRNDAVKSSFFVDSSARYEVVAAEYLGSEVVKEPHWLQYMRQWGPTVEYDSKSELNKVAILLRLFLRVSVQNIFDFFPTELYGEKGPVGPKQKNNWVGDEIE